MSRPMFSIEITWQDVPPDPFSADGFLNGVKIAEARGYCCQKGRLDIERIDVFPQYRGNGYGTAMIYRLIAAAKGKGCTKLYFLGVDKTNHDAIRLYKRLCAVATQMTGSTTKDHYVIDPL